MMLKGKMGRKLGMMMMGSELRVLLEVKMVLWRWLSLGLWWTEEEVDLVPNKTSFMRKVKT